MTREELEKKAEEYATEQEKNCILGVYDNTEDLQYDEGYNRGYVIGLEEGYIAGAKENQPTIEEMIKRLVKGGYVKSGIYEKKEEVIWHDLRKNPNDLPKRNGEYLTNIGVLVFDSSLGNRWQTFHCIACDLYEDVTNKVVAWCEIPKYTEE